MMNLGKGKLPLFALVLATLCLTCGPKYPRRVAVSCSRPDSAAWTTFKGDEGRTSFSPETLELPLKLLWRFETSAPIVASPCAKGGLLYFGSLDTKLKILDARSGKRMADLGLKGRVSSSCALEGNTLLVATERGSDQLVAIDLRTGRTRWRRMARDVSSSPLVTSGMVAVGTGDGYLLVYSIDRGDLVWRFKTGGAISTSPAKSGGTIFCGSLDRYLYALDAATGELRWKFKAGGSVSAAPATSDSLVFFGSTDSCLYALTIQEGREVWRAKTGGEVFSSPAVDNKTLYFGSNDRRLYALEIESGTVRWSFETGSLVQAPPLVTEHLVICPSFDGHLYILDRESGSPLWKYRTGGMLTASAVVYQGRVYLPCSDGDLYCFAPGR
jgi:outer membrane protein assembly factor BamB